MGFRLNDGTGTRLFQTAQALHTVVHHNNGNKLGFGHSLAAKCIANNANARRSEQTTFSRRSLPVQGTAVPYSRYRSTLRVRSRFVFAYRRTIVVCVLCSASARSACELFCVNTCLRYIVHVTVAICCDALARLAACASPFLSVFVPIAAPAARQSLHSR